MKSENKVRWGILGCGRIADKFASDLALSDTGYLYAVASRETSRGKAFASKHNAVICFDHYTSLASCAEVDVIYIATPHAFHYEHSMLCIGHQKHVLCEKPLAVNFQQVSLMFKEAQNHQVLLMEAMWTAFLPAMLQIKSLIDSGQIGEIRRIEADFGFNAEYHPESRLFNPELAGGSLLDIGIYPLFVTMYLLGLPDDIKATATLAPTGVDMECSILLKYKNGATASLFSGFSCHTDIKCDIYGTKGKITVPSRFHEQEKFYLQLNQGDIQTIHPGRTGLGYYHEIVHVHECLLNKRLESNIMNHERSLQLIKMMDNIRNQIGVFYKAD